MALRFEFFQLILSNREYLKSKTLQSLIKGTTTDEKKSKQKLSEKYGDEYKELEDLLDYNNSKNNDLLSNFEYSKSPLQFKRDIPYLFLI